MRIESQDIIPQRPPFVMVDFLESFSDDLVKTSFTVREDNLFLQQDGTLSEAGILETIAQSCAARTGYIARYIHHKPVDIGYIGQIKGLEIYSRPRLGQTLWVEVHVLNEIFGITQIRADVFTQDGLIASGGMKLAAKY